MRLGGRKGKRGMGGGREREEKGRCWDMIEEI